MRNRSGATAPVFSCLTAKHNSRNRAECQTISRAFDLPKVASDHLPVTAAELASPARNAALTIHGDGDPGLSLASIVVADRSQSPPEHVCNPLHIGSQRRSSHSLRADRDDASIIRTGPGNALPEYMPSRRQSEGVCVCVCVCVFVCVCVYMCVLISAPAEPGDGVLLVECAVLKGDWVGGLPADHLAASVRLRA